MIGDQRPRLCSLPDSDSVSAGQDAIALASMAGLRLDDWQKFVLVNSLAKAGDKWAAFEVLCILSRQNGKGAILEARELAGLFLFNEKLIIHTAHEFLRLAKRLSAVCCIGLRIRRSLTAACPVSVPRMARKV